MSGFIFLLLGVLLPLAMMALLFLGVRSSLLSGENVVSKGVKIFAYAIGCLYPIVVLYYFVGIGSFLTTAW